MVQANSLVSNTMHDRHVLLFRPTFQKWAAEGATKRVSGVRTVAQDLKVKVVGDHIHSDSEIAGAVLNAIKWDVFVPNAVTANVHDGWVTWRANEIAGLLTMNYLGAEELVLERWENECGSITH